MLWIPISTNGVTLNRMQLNLLIGSGHSFLAIVTMAGSPLDGSVIAPLLLQCGEPQKATLQDLINEWHLSDPYVCVFLQPHSLICGQIDRFPSLDCKFCEPIYWSRAEVLLPIFDATHGFSVTWHNFHVLASVLHLGPLPQSGHGVSTLHSSLSLLTADDGARPRQTFMSEDIASECYMLWLAPATQLQHWRWRQPICRTVAGLDDRIPMMTHSHDLLGTSFDPWDLADLGMTFLKCPELSATATQYGQIHYMYIYVK